MPEKSTKEFPEILSNLEIDELVGILGLTQYKGCWSKDRIPPAIQKNLKPGDFMILNLQDENDGGGSHWICFTISSGKLMYFDSYGLYPPRIVRRIAHANGIDHVDYQNEMLQKTSQLCGWFCLMFIKLIQSGTPFSDITPATVNDETVARFRNLQSPNGF